MKSDPNKYVLHFSFEAIDDLKDIFQYSEETFGYSTTIKYRKILNTGIQQIIKMPTIGHRKFKAKNDVLAFNIGSHVVFYHFFEALNEVRIIRVLHSRMNFKGHL